MNDATHELTPKGSVYYDDLPYDRSELEAVLRETYAELIDFVTSAEFRAVVDEMNRLPAEARPTFVKKVLLNHTALADRGVVAPEGILIQRSAFGDRRPTLFVVKKFLPEKYHSSWENANITFYAPFRDEEVSRDPSIAWRTPLPVELQSQLMARGIDLQSIEASRGS